MSHERLLTVAGSIAALALAVLLGLWIRLPLEFTRPCRLLPQAEWILIRTGPDTFEARLITRTAGERQTLDIFRFERGDVVRFEREGTIRPGARVAAGDEVAYLRSHASRAARQTSALELLEAEAGLRTVETGGKAEIVARTRGEMAAAQALRAQRETESRRTARLHEAGLASDAQHETAASLLEQAEANLSAARSALEAVEVGEKSAIVEAYLARVELLRGRLAEAALRVDAETLRSPIAGEVMALQADSALVRIADTDTLYAFSPVPPSRVFHLRPGRGAVVQAMGSPVRARGWVVSVDSEASAVAGRTFFWATVAIPNPDGLLRPGLEGSLRFTGAPVTLLAWVVDRVRHASDRALGA